MSYIEIGYCIWGLSYLTLGVVSLYILGQLVEVYHDADKYAKQILLMEFLATFIASQALGINFYTS